MTRVAQTLERRLRKWPKEMARAVEKEVTALIKTTDRKILAKTRKSNRSKAKDPFFEDRDFFGGSGPEDTASRHDDHLYGDNS